MDNMQQHPDQQDTQAHYEQPEPTHALPTTFAHADIAELYQQGYFTSRMDAELADMLYQQDAPPSQQKGGDTNVPLPLENTDQLKVLNCIALIQDGYVLPIVDIEQMPLPAMLQQRVRLYHQTARTLLDAIAAILEERENEVRQRTTHQQRALGTQDDNIHDTPLIEDIHMQSVHEGIKDHPELTLVALVDEQGKVIPVVEANNTQEEQPEQRS